VSVYKNVKTDIPVRADKLGLRQIRREDTSNIVNKLNWSSVEKAQALLQETSECRNY
jgi:hypothetical protein